MPRSRKSYKTCREVGPTIRSRRDKRRSAGDLMRSVLKAIIDAE